MLYIIFILLIGGVEFSLASEYTWKQKQLSYWSHQEQLERNKVDKIRFREAHMLRKEAQKRRNERVKRVFINKKFTEDNREKADYLLQTYIQEDLREKDLLKNKFLQKREKENIWKKRYPIPEGSLL